MPVTEGSPSRAWISSFVLRQVRSVPVRAIIAAQPLDRQNTAAIRTQKPLVAKDCQPMGEHVRHVSMALDSPKLAAPSRLVARFLSVPGDLREALFSGGDRPILDASTWRA